MIAAATIPLFVWLEMHSWPFLIAAVVCALLIVFAHRGNIGRLVQGTESRI
jgi:glycerol-3-phosphate acyltransferase PlsY